MLQALIDLRWHVYDGLLVQACLTGMLASRGYAVTCCLRRLPAMFVVSRHVKCVLVTCQDMFYMSCLLKT